jgi:plastocyanin
MWAIHDVAGAVLAVMATLSGTIDVHGTARTGDRRTKNAVVWLDVPESAPRPSTRAILDQRNLMFSPTVLVVAVGTVVEFPNNDRIVHNVFSFRDGKVFDLGFYPVGAVKRVTFDRPGLSRIFCNIHPAMAAYVLTVDSVHFGVTDDRGRFRIPSVRPGTYTFHAWRPGGPVLTGSASFDGEQPLDVQWP